MKKMDFKECLSLLILFVALLIGATTKNGYSFGDSLFHSLGLKAWSHGEGISGTHYVAIFSIVLAIFGILLPRSYFTGMKFMVLLLAISILSPSVISTGRGIYLSSQSGLEALEFDARKTRISYFSDDEQKVSLTAYFKLISHSKDPVNFHVKFIPISDSSKEIFKTDTFLGQATDEKIKDFFINPGETRDFEATIKVKNKSRFTGIKGEESLPKIVIFNDQEQKSLLRSY